MATNFNTDDWTHFMRTGESPKPIKIKLTSDILKTAIMSYYRFKRQMICADEVYCGDGLSDVLVESSVGFYDIEIKISKSDLWNGEAKKNKHALYKKQNATYLTLMPNYFIVCVPETLVETAKEWTEQTNSKYGILAFSESEFIRLNNTARKDFRFIESCIRTVRTPKSLCRIKSDRLHGLLVSRLNSAYLNKRQKDLDKIE